MAKITIEVHTFSLRKRRKTENIDFGADPNLFKIFSSYEEGIISFIDNSLTKNIPHLQRTISIPEMSTDIFRNESYLLK
ncbi:MAG: hypothetical protein LUF85_02385 [Bacteroides sp.]|nr:hypothetical protein [Bacteroides sp.]